MLETRWHIVRHAPVDNPEGRIYGASDKPANTSDITAFQALARHLPTGAVSVTSHLQRTHQTLDAIRAAGLKLPEPVVDEGLGDAGTMLLPHGEPTWGYLYRFMIPPLVHRVILR